ncbi:MAG: hypothetical protein NZM40_00350 [Sphingomonadaceae bacterium]|uniref:flagellar hook assembly protein FlgD n=1 Tax=Thermaurantiacus sp. TaxID=2820283 RepID=UPI00298F1C04|nr:flagellar hook capping FlgD N-terminal domain-containing protein [Thermaurantiacus sp.]MCS6985892.1 hypothetical protein [Sphingomonadaceae bacterium]MDW8414892.1 flagellar hook capping FlgD N-terminal domain-containing protein [Thermaurantiacus sp.]
MSAPAPVSVGAAVAPADAGRRTLGQEDFLLLLTTQLKAQDPLSPLDNTQFVAQLAQFAAVSGIAETNARLARLTALQADVGRHAAPAWLGRQVAAADGTGGQVAAVEIGADLALILVLADGRRLPLAQVRAVG